MPRKQVNVCLPENWARAMVELATANSVSQPSVYLAAMELLLNCPAPHRRVLLRFFNGRKHDVLAAMTPGRCAAVISAEAEALQASAGPDFVFRSAAPARPPARRRPRKRP